MLYFGDFKWRYETGCHGLERLLPTQRLAGFATAALATRH